MATNANKMELWSMIEKKIDEVVSEKFKFQMPLINAKIDEKVENQMELIGARVRDLIKAAVGNEFVSSDRLVKLEEEIMKTMRKEVIDCYKRMNAMHREACRNHDTQFTIFESKILTQYQTMLSNSATVKMIDTVHELVNNLRKEQMICSGKIGELRVRQDKFSKLNKDYREILKEYKKATDDVLKVGTSKIDACITRCHMDMQQSLKVRDAIVDYYNDMMTMVDHVREIDVQFNSFKERTEKLDKAASAFGLGIISVNNIYKKISGMSKEIDEKMNKLGLTVCGLTERQMEQDVKHNDQTSELTKLITQLDEKITANAVDAATITTADADTITRLEARIAELEMKLIPALPLVTTPAQAPADSYTEVEET